MNDWIGVSDLEPMMYEAFVYRITHIPTGKYYIGKKNFWVTIKRKPLKGRVNKRHKIVESDWKTYFGSSQELLDDVKKYGEDQFKREILVLCRKKGMASYFELYIQLQQGVLFDDNSYNNIVNARLNGNIFKNNKEDCKRILKEINGRV